MISADREEELKKVCSYFIDEIFIFYKNKMKELDSVLDFKENEFIHVTMNVAANFMLHIILFVHSILEDKCLDTRNMIAKKLIEQVLQGLKINEKH